MTDPWTQQDIIDADRRYLWHPFTQMQEWQDADPLVIEAAQVQVRGVCVSCASRKTKDRRRSPA